MVVAGDDRKSVRLRADEIVKAFVATGAKINEQVGNVRDDVEGQVGHEHFGFDDGVSQPASADGHPAQMTTSSPTDMWTAHNFRRPRSMAIRDRIWFGRVNSSSVIRKQARTR